MASPASLATWLANSSTLVHCKEGWKHTHVVARPLSCRPASLLPSVTHPAPRLRPWKDGLIPRRIPGVEPLQGWLSASQGCWEMDECLALVSGASPPWLMSFNVALRVSVNCLEETSCGEDKKSVGVFVRPSRCWKWATREGGVYQWGLQQLEWGGERWLFVSPGFGSLCCAWKESVGGDRLSQSSSSPLSSSDSSISIWPR